LVLVALLGWFGIRFVAERVSSGGECVGPPVTLKIAAAPEIAPVLTQVAEKLSHVDRHLAARCYSVRVNSMDPARVATALEGKADTQPDVWLPDSSFWLARVRGDGVSTVPERGISVASSPVVIALSEPVARSLGWPNAKLSWPRLLTGNSAVQNMRLGIPDPVRNPVGVSAVLAISSLTAKDGKPSPATVSLLRQLSGNVSALSNDLFGKLPAAADPVSIGKGLGGFPASEQAVASYDAQHPVVPVVPVYQPVSASAGLDYPYVPSTTLAAPGRVAANRFLGVLQRSEASQMLNAAGFRTPSGGTGRDFPASHGLDTGILGPAPLSDTGRVAQAIGVWNTITLPTRLLSVVDVSGSMNEEVPGTRQSRMQITINAWMQTIGLFADDSEMGLWVFSTNLGGGRDYRELVPIGPLSTQRSALAGATTRIQAKEGGGTGLYDTVLAAYQRVSEHWDPARSNAVAVFTDGENSDDHGISRSALLAELKKRYDPKKPVRIVFLGMGPDVDAAELAQIAKATHGLSFVARDPSKMRDIYLQALAARVCQPPNC
jgi:hypothetical protein